MDPINSNSDNEASKRQAMTGQWRTPPLPVFASNTSGAAAAPTHGQPMPPQPAVGMQQHHHQQQPSADTTANSNSSNSNIQLPSSTDDYTKALQEAYRRGAEAAAAMQQQQQQQHLPNAVSCPNFHGVGAAGTMGTAPAPTTSGVASTTTTTTTTTAAGGQAQGMAAPPHTSSGLHHHHHHLAGSDAAVAHAAAAQAGTHSMSTLLPATATTTTGVAVPNPLAASVAGIPQQQGSVSAVGATAGDVRSFSLPDMASYAARAQAEEEKRKKRLARNRASARLRRLRKKNLVDSYEGEVGVLELSLQKLKAHEWGGGHSHEALLEALGMERGQQALGLQERQALVEEILQQQRDQLAFLREAQLEQQVLKEFVMATTSNSDGGVDSSNNNNEQGLWQELDGVLNLTQEQKDSLLKATTGLDEEVEAMETLETCLEAMKDRLTNDSVHNLTQQFMGIFHTNQIQKFLLWADANAEAIDQLDYCHAGPPATSPIFSFGMDDYGGASQLHFNTNMEEEGP